MVGLIERSRPDYKGKFVVESVANRNAQTLVALIQKYVREGSCLHSDMWKGYVTWHIADIGIWHRVVNHTLHFKDPVTGVHTNTIEGMWQSLKHRVPRQAMSLDRVNPYLWEFMWRRRYDSIRWARLVHCWKNIRYNDVHELDVQQPQPAVADQAVDDDADHAVDDAVNNDYDWDFEPEF